MKEIYIEWLEWAKTHPGGFFFSMFAGTLSGQIFIKMFLN